MAPKKVLHKVICSKKEEFFYGNCCFLAKAFCLIEKFIKLLIMSILIVNLLSHGQEPIHSVFNANISEIIRH